MALDGSSTIVLPPRRAGAIFRVTVAAGKFHGVIRDHDSPRNPEESHRLAGGHTGDFISGEGTGERGVVLEVVNRATDLGAALVEDLSHLVGDELGEFFGARAQSFRGSEQDLGPLGRSDGLPAGLSFRRGFHRRARILGRGASDPADDRPVGRVGDLRDPATAGGKELIIEKESLRIGGRDIRPMGPSPIRLTAVSRGSGGGQASRGIRSLRRCS